MYLLECVHECVSTWVCAPVCECMPECDVCTFECVQCACGCQLYACLIPLPFHRKHPVYCHIPQTFRHGLEVTHLSSDTTAHGGPWDRLWKGKSSHTGTSRSNEGPGPCPGGGEHLEDRRLSEAEFTQAHNTKQHVPGTSWLSLLIVPRP